MEEIDKFINSVEARYGVCGGPLWDRMRKLARLGALVEAMPVGAQLDHIRDEEDQDVWNFYVAEGTAKTGNTPTEALVR
jgi:hypothetical protein